MIGGAGDVSLANDRLIIIQPPAHTMSNSNVANGARMWGQCPEIPQVLGCRRVPKRHAGSAAQRGCWTSQEILKGARICAKADASFSQGVRLILRSVIVTFPTPQTPFVFARSKRKGEKECIAKRNNRTFRRSWPTT